MCCKTRVLCNSSLAVNFLPRDFNRVPVTYPEEKQHVTSLTDYSLLHSPGNFDFWVNSPKKKFE